MWARCAIPTRREDLLDIWINIAPENPRAADSVFDRIEHSAGLLKRHPELGRARPEIDKDARCLVVERWLILHRLVEGGVQIVRIVDGARDLSRIEWPRSE